MLLTLVNVVYVLVAIALVVLILLQRGAGANAGSGFGAGASATVFGARGSANFLSKSTAVLATLFFVISLGMAMYAARSVNSPAVDDDLGVMGAMPAPSDAPTAPATGGTDLPVAPVNSDVPAANSAPAAESVEKEGEN